MDLKSQIDKDFIEAYKNKNEDIVSVLRMFKSAIKNLEIAEKRALANDDFIRVLKKEVKQRLDSAAEYSRAGREDLAAKEQSEVLILKKYLPKELTDEETVRIVDESITEVGATKIKDMGRVISLVMQKSGGAADGAKIAALVRSKLQK